jgi:hypothetical protein
MRALVDGHVRRRPEFRALRVSAARREETRADTRAGLPPRSPPLGTGNGTAGVSRWWEGGRARALLREQSDGAPVGAPEQWTMPPLALLARPEWSTGRKVAMLTLRGYLVASVILLIVKAAQLGGG